MDTKDVFKEKIEAQLSKWKSTIDGLKATVARAEVDAKAKLHEQVDLLHDKRVKAEKMLEEISATSHDAWDQVKSGAEQGWSELTRTAKKTITKVQEAIAKPKQDEEIRQIAYHLWQEEGYPDGRHLEHWVKAESIWHERHAVPPPDRAPRARAKRKRKTTTPAKSRARKTKSTSDKGNIARGPKEP